VTPSTWSIRRRLLLASAALAVVVALVFLALVQAVLTLRTATAQERHAKDITAAALVLQTLVVDLEIGIRRFVITRDEVFLEPWARARGELPTQLERFRELARSDPMQQQRAERLVTAIVAYEQDYTVPLVTFVTESPEVAATALATAEGEERLSDVRARLDAFLEVETARAAAIAARADERAEIAIALGVAALAASALLIALFGLYLASSIARPVQEVARTAGLLASGDLDVRLDVSGPGEVGELTRTFNHMAEALAQGRADLETQNERLRQSEQLKTELIAIVSHELRTPLASMLGFTTLLIERETDPETRQRYLEIIASQGRRLASLLDDFLNVQRLEEGRLELASELVDVAAVLREQAQLYSAESDRHRLELRLAEQHLPVRGDPDRLAQVIGNLLSNAIKYSPSGGRVEIVGEHENGTVRISVRDEGVGIPVHQQEKIFTKFFRGDAAASGIAGSGLGLAFARAVVEAHGGRMSFTSESGKGSVFRVELPTQAQTRAQAAETGAAGSEAKGD
jgi:signal transduction histidine kinase